MQNNNFNNIVIFVGIILGMAGGFAIGLSNPRVVTNTITKTPKVCVDVLDQDGEWFTLMSDALNNNDAASYNALADSINQNLNSRMANAKQCIEQQ